MNNEETKNCSNYTTSMSETKIVFVIVFMVEIAPMSVAAIKKRPVMRTVALAPILLIVEFLQRNRKKT